MDVTDVTTAIESQGTNVATIGGVILGVLAIVAGVSYLRRVVR